MFYCGACVVVLETVKDGSMSTKQAETWLSQFGAEYTSRNNLALEDYEKLYVDTIGVTRSALNEVFFANVPKDARILEVGTNVGN